MELDPLNRITGDVVEMTEREKPGTLIHLAYVNEDGTETTIVHLFTNASALDLHILGVDELTKKRYELMESERLDIYSIPSDKTLEMMRKIVGSGVSLS